MAEVIPKATEKHEIEHGIYQNQYLFGLLCVSGLPQKEQDLFKLY